MDIKEVISRAINGEELSKEERNRLFFYFRHIPNIRKSDEEFELYCKMAAEKGLPKPDRNSYIRPLHEKR
ncbi:MAG: hypothetical protein Q4A75_01555 [Peptostreptococcaceae bacterium]|nr:hypothetical protein [Peptostreptococcaceae bacterium]